MGPQYWLGVFSVAGHPQPSCSGSSCARPRLILSPAKSRQTKKTRFFPCFSMVFPRTCWTVWLDTSQLKNGETSLHWNFRSYFFQWQTWCFSGTSFRSPTCCICATCFAVATSVIHCARWLVIEFAALFRSPLEKQLSFFAWNMDKYGMWMCYQYLSIFPNSIFIHIPYGWFPNPQHGRSGMMDPFSFDERSRGRALENVAMELTADERKMLKGWRRKNHSSQLYPGNLSIEMW